MTQELNQLIQAILADDIITDQEREVLHAKAAKEGISAAEIDVLVDGMLEQKKREQKKSAPKGRIQESLGVVHKCPNCGSPVETGKLSCTYCGYEFRGMDANSSTKELADLISKASDETKQTEIIQNFPVPTTKEDLLEFIFLTKSKAFGFNNIADAYRKKYYECTDKATFYFNNDPQFASIIQEANKNKKNIWKNLSFTVKKWVLFGLGLIIFIIFSFIMQIRQEEKNERERREGKKRSFFGYVIQEKQQDTDIKIINI